jgi:hypothetical protein
VEKRGELRCEEGSRVPRAGVVAWGGAGGSGGAGGAGATGSSASDDEYGGSLTPHATPVAP